MILEGICFGRKALCLTCDLKITSSSIETFDAMKEFAESCARFERKTEVMGVIFDKIYRRDFTIEDLRAISEAKFGVSKYQEDTAVDMFLPKVMAALEKFEASEVVPLIGGLGAFLLYMPKVRDFRTAPGMMRMKRGSSMEMLDSASVGLDLSCSISEYDEDD